MNRIDKMTRLCAMLMASLVLLFPLTADETITRADGVEIITLGRKTAINEMAVYPKGGIANRPLLMMAHGNGGSGPKEIEGWLELAKKHNFTIVCPTFVSGQHSIHLPEDVPYFADCLTWLKANLQYNKNQAFMTGFSGGGYAVWYLGTTRPDFFQGLFLQSGNFAGQSYEIDLAPWRDRPIHLIWGTQDSPTVMAQNKEAVALAKSEHLTQFSIEIIPGARHQPHHDLVVAWMEQLVSPSGSR